MTPSLRRLSSKPLSLREFYARKFPRVAFPWTSFSLQGGGASCKSWMELDNTGFGIRLIRSSHQGNIVQHWLSSVMPLQSTVAFNKLQALLAKNASWLPDAYFIFSAPYGSVDVKILGTTLNTDWVGHWVIREKKS